MWRHVAYTAPVSTPMDAQDPKCGGPLPLYCIHARTKRSVYSRRFDGELLTFKLTLARTKRESTWEVGGGGHISLLCVIELRKTSG